MPRPEIQLPDDQISADLGALSDGLESRLHGVAKVENFREPDTGLADSAWITPRSPGSVGIRWEQYDDVIVVGVLGCVGWDLPRTAAGVTTVAAVIDAAVTGAIEVGVGRGQTHYRVRLPDGSVLEDVHEGFKAWLLSMPWKPRLVWSTTAPYS